MRGQCCVRRRSAGACAGPDGPGSALAAPSLSFPMRKTGLMIPTSCRAVRKLGVAKS